MFDGKLRKIHKQFVDYLHLMNFPMIAQVKCSLLSIYMCLMFFFFNIRSVTIADVVLCPYLIFALD